MLRQPRHLEDRELEQTENHLDADRSEDRLPALVEPAVAVAALVPLVTSRRHQHHDSKLEEALLAAQS